MDVLYLRSTTANVDLIPYQTNTTSKTYESLMHVIIRYDMSTPGSGFEVFWSGCSMMQATTSNSIGSARVMVLPST
jgi:hypothetical protein